MTDFREGDLESLVDGRYRLERILGRGGAGLVVMATHVHLDQEVAIKFLLPKSLGEPGAIARFEREARTAAKLSSEHVVRVRDLGRSKSDGCPFIVMEYLEGKNLAQLISERGPLPVAECVLYALHACEALAEAHAAGIVHRDIKPANLVVTRKRDGSRWVKIVDFGISMGSPGFMSPEQMHAPEDVDARTDIWALGATLYQALAGRPAFEGKTVSELCERVLVDTPAPIRRIPAKLEAIVRRCLAKKREARFANVGELATALAAFAPASAKISFERAASVFPPPRDEGPARRSHWWWGAVPIAFVVGGLAAAITNG